MSARTDHRPWSIARLLLATHLPFLLIVWVVFVGLVLALTIGIAIWGDITRSVWDPAVTVVRWFALGYGLFLVNRLLAVYVAHGRTRRDYLGSIAVFVAAAAAVLAALLTLGFTLEAILYRAMDWPHRVETQRVFDAPDQYPAIFVSYWAMLIVWTTIGLLLAAGFYRSGGGELLVIPVALAMAAVSGYAIGFHALPFTGHVIELSNSPLATALGLCAAALVVGAALVWALVRDIPIRPRTA
jgi:hypothetical protein